MRNQFKDFWVAVWETCFEFWFYQITWWKWDQVRCWAKQRAYFTFLQVVQTRRKRQNSGLGTFFAPQLCRKGKRGGTSGDKAEIFEPHKCPQQKGSPLWLAHIRGAFWRLKSLPCSFPDKGRASRHESIPQNSVCSGELDDVIGTEMRENLIKSIKRERIIIVRAIFFLPRKGRP